MRISDWSSDVCSSDLVAQNGGEPGEGGSPPFVEARRMSPGCEICVLQHLLRQITSSHHTQGAAEKLRRRRFVEPRPRGAVAGGAGSAEGGEARRAPRSRGAAGGGAAGGAGR